jgi:hypothetical protein
MPLGDHRPDRVAGARRTLVEIEEALGPGVDFERGAGMALVGRRPRVGGPWVGFDRGAVLDSDDGAGRLVPIVVAVPTSTFRGARLEVEVSGGWQVPGGIVLVGRLPGAPDPVEVLARLAARVSDDARPLRLAEVEGELARARQRHRERRSHDRIIGGRAWHAVDALPPELARYGTPHSQAEYSLRRLPPRFVRGLEGLLDDDERILYWVERPTLADPTLGQWIRGVDRRAALLVLTDRQLLWIVDHAQPNRELLDWGVDVELMPVERITAATVGDVAARRHGTTLEVDTVAGRRQYRLPVELTDELGVMRNLIRRFTPGSSRLPARRYDLVARPFDPQVGARFGQADVARELHDRATAGGPVVAFLFSPTRPGQRQAAALVLRPDGLEVLRAGGRRDEARSAGRCPLALDDVIVVRETLSPLVGRISTEGRRLDRAGGEPPAAIAFTTPAPLMDGGAALVRLARRAMANRPRPASG